MERDLTSGSVFQNIVSFSLPYLLSYFLQTLYGMADLFIIGQFNGVDSITAVSVGGQVMHMLTVMIVGLAMGSTVTIAKAVGGKGLDPDFPRRGQYGYAVYGRVCRGDGSAAYICKVCGGGNVYAGGGVFGDGGLSYYLLCGDSLYHSVQYYQLGVSGAGGF